MSKTGSKGSSGFNIGGLFTFALVAMFAILALLVAVVGIRAYQSVLNTADHTVKVRASMNYIANKIRTQDSLGAIQIAEEEGKQALLIGEQLEGDRYITRIFFHEGALYEQFSTADIPLDPELSERLTELSDFAIEQTGSGLIRMTVTMDNGTAHTMNVLMRSGAWGVE